MRIEKYQGLDIGELFGKVPDIYIDIIKYFYPVKVNDDLWVSRQCTLVFK